LLRCRLRIAQEPPCTLEDDFTELGQLYATAGPVKQGFAPFLLQRFDDAADGRLCHAEVDCRACEAAAFGCRHKNPQIVQVDHRQDIRKMNVSYRSHALDGLQAGMLIRPGAAAGLEAVGSEGGNHETTL